MDWKLTGKYRFRQSMGKIILQVEEERKEYDVVVGHIIYSHWRDARIEDITEDFSTNLNIKAKL